MSEAAAPRLDSSVVVGRNDAEHCMEGWSPPRPRRDGSTARWMRRTARARLRAPAEPLYVGLDLFVPAVWRGARVSLHLLARNLWLNQSPQTVPYLDVCMRLQPGVRQRIEFPFAERPFPGDDVELLLTIEVSAPQPPWHAGAALHGLWLRGDRVEAGEVTIIVLNWKRADETITCLESLAAAELGGARVLVVDNGSGDDSVAAIRARFPEQEILALPRNEGYAGGNNAGVRAALDAGAKAVLLLNNDTQVGADFLHPLLWVLNGPHAAAAVSSAIFRTDYPDLLDCAYLELFFGHGIVYRRGVNALPGEGFDWRREVDAGIGCCLLIAADALGEVGLLDEAYFAYHEEVDWCFRARQLGWRIYYEPYSRIWHGGSKSTASADAPDRAQTAGEQLPSPVPLSWSPIRAYLGARNTVRFVRAHGSVSQRLYFLLSSLYEVPLELSAVLARQEPALKIGAWTFRRALTQYLRGEHSGDASGASAPARLLLLPLAALWTLPRTIRQAQREGRTAQVGELVRGLWDGVLDRPLPLERLGLR